MKKNLFFFFMLLSVFHTSGQSTELEELDETDLFRKEFHAIFFNTDLIRTQGDNLSTTETKYYTGDSTSTPRHTPFFGVTKFKHQGIDFFISFNKQSLPTDIKILKSYFYYKRNYNKYEQYYDTSNYEAKIGYQEVLDSLLTNDFEKSNRSIENQLQLCTKIQDRITHYYVFSQKACMEIQIAIPDKSDIEFMKLHNYSFNELDKLEVIEGILNHGLQYCIEISNNELNWDCHQIYEMSN